MQGIDRSETKRCWFFFFLLFF